jgi:GMP synthase-like glutamine amidotransferase
MSRSRGDGGTVVLVVANASDPDTGYVGERFAERGHRFRTVLRDRGEVDAAVPGDVGHLLLLGSEWSVHAPADREALDRECSLVCSARAAGVPVLGLCYGAQVLAHALGGSVTRADAPEVGLVSVESTDPELVASGPWCAFHADVVEAPPAAQVVARNAFGVQAFVLPDVLGVQFHPEVRPDVLEGWAARFPAMVDEAGAVAADLVDEMRRCEARARRLAYGLVDTFLDRASGP